MLIRLLTVPRRRSRSRSQGGGGGGGGGGPWGAHGGTAEPGTDAHFRNLFRNQGSEKGSESGGKRVAVHGMQARAKWTKQAAVETAETTETAERHGGQSEREGFEPDGWTIVRPRGRRGAAPVGGGAPPVPGAGKRKRPMEAEGRAPWWRKVHQWDPRMRGMGIQACRQALARAEANGRGAGICINKCGNNPLNGNTEGAERPAAGTAAAAKARTQSEQGAGQLQLKGGDEYMCLRHILAWFGHRCPDTYTGGT
jgi:hypothetical protein